MDFRLIRRLVADKLRDRTTYVVAAVVGTLISAYGQLLVPWIRSGSDPFAAFAAEFERTPVLTLLSVFLAYAFPFCVGIYSAVAVRYNNRRIESIADFPERKPDPVFRADRNGQPVEVGATTQELFDKYRVDSAQKILGDEIWERIVSTDIPHIPSKFVEIVPLSHRQGNCIPYAAIRWHDFGNRPALGRPLGHFSRHPDTPLLSLSPRRRFPRPTPERVFVADHQSSSGFSGTGPSAPPPQPIGT